MNRIRSAILMSFVALCLLFVGALGFLLKNPSFSSTEYSPVEMSPLSDQLEKHVAFLVNLKPPRNFENIESLNSAAQYVFDEFASLGLMPEFQTYKIGLQEYKNVRALIPGKSEKLIVLGAHYDVSGDTPGADDNASGVAGLIELARILKELQSELSYSIELAAYTLEEPPYFGGAEMGSYQHAHDLFKNNKSVELMIALEMIGYFTEKSWSQDYPNPLMRLFYPSKGNFISLVGDTKSRKLVRKLKTLFQTGTQLPIESINAPRFIPGIDFSDHRNYWLFGYPAVMLTDTAFYRNKNYHELTDSIETLDFEKMAEVVKGVVAIVLRLSKN